MESNVAKKSVLFIFLTLTVKLAGMLRDIVVSYYFGDSYQADAYLAAFVIVNMLFLFFTNGMKNVFIPNYIKATEANNGECYFLTITKATLILSVLFILLGRLLFSYLLPIFYSGMEEVSLHLTIDLARLLILALFFVGLNAVLEAYLDAHSKYTISALAQFIVLVSLLISAVLFAQQFGVYVLALGYLVGTFISFIFKLFFIPFKGKLLWNHRLNIKEATRFYINFLPVALTVMVGQINLTIDQVFASRFGEGAVTYINYAKNLSHLPQAIFGVTIGVIVFPIMAKAYAKKEQTEFTTSIRRGMQTMFYILIPAIAGLYFLMPSLIELFYQRGAFTRQATLATTQVAYYYLGSVLFFSMNVVVSNGLYTLNKGRKMMIISLASVVLNILLNIIFTRQIGYIGIPLASSVIGLYYVVTCYFTLTKHTGSILKKENFIESVKILGITILMLMILTAVETFIINTGLVLHVILLVLLGITSYLILSYLFKIDSFQFLSKQLKQVAQR